MEMEYVLCENCNRYYNPEKYSHCPHCNGEQTVGAVPGLMRGPVDSDETLADIPVRNTAGGANETIPRKKFVADDDDLTRRYVEQKKNDPVSDVDGFDPVVGWLVCTEGNNRGRDYRILAGQNAIGRAKNNPICIPGDETISREKHAFVIYDSKDKIFYLRPGDGRNTVHLNDKVLLTPTQLKPYDKIELGSTMLLFVPLCGQDFDWEERTDE